MKPTEAYILNQQEPFRSILLHLHAVIEATIADVELLYKYKIPFYYINKKPFCYLNCTKGYVDVGFWNAAHLTLHQEQLVSKDRKHMKSLRYFTLEEINQEVLIDILQEAYSVRDRKYYK